MKCYKCNKKTLLEFKCKCERKYCIKCRMPEIHECEFNHADKTNLKSKRDSLLLIHTLFYMQLFKLLKNGLWLTLQLMVII